MANHTYLTAFFALLAVTSPAMPSRAQGAVASKIAKPQFETKLTGKSYLCDWGPYQVKFEFLSETQLKWTYIKAPPSELGKTETETLDRHDLRSNLILMTWTEADGTELVDVLDVEKMQIYINFINPGKKRTSVQLKLTPVK